MDKMDFESALKPHYEDALRYCHSLAARTYHTEAEDLFQESVLKALRKYHQLVDKAKFKVWFFQIVTRTYISQTRLAYWKHLLRLPPNATHIPDVYADYEITGERTVLLNALAQLPTAHRAAFLLFELGGFSINEIRVIQGDRSLSAVKSRLSRARKKMKAYIIELERNQKRLNRKSALKDLDYELYQTTQQALERLNG